MANSVTARFNDDCKVFVAMSDDTTVEKAVIIDAEGNETEIGGGGSSDFSTATVTISGLAEMATLPIPIIDPEYGETFGIGQTAVNGENTVVLYKGVASLYTPLTLVVTGDITYDSELDTYFIHGNGTITVTT